MTQSEIVTPDQPKMTIHEARLIRQIKSNGLVTWRALAEMYYTPDQVGYYGDQMAGRDLCQEAAQLLQIEEEALDETPRDWREQEQIRHTTMGKLLYK